MSSNIEMNRFRVLDACNAYIENTDRHVKKVREREITQKMKPISIFGFKFLVCHTKRQRNHSNRICGRSII